MPKNCECPEDWRAIPKERRVELMENGAVQFVNGVKIVDKTKLHIFDRDCPVHGYKEITE